MRWLMAGTLLSLLSGMTFFTYFHFETSSLGEFCASVAPGDEMIKIRKSAAAQGFAPKLEPYSQMRIEPKGYWHAKRPACRIFFNQEQIVEYRIWQNS